MIIPIPGIEGRAPEIPVIAPPEEKTGIVRR